MTTNQAPARPSLRVAILHFAWIFPTGWSLIWGAMAIFP